jgi:hypothetical protein
MTPKTLLAQTVRSMLLVWLVAIGIFVPVQIAPIARTAFKTPELSYGFVTAARRSPLLGKVELEVNSDSRTAFLLWPGRYESSRVSQWLRGETPYEIWSVPIGPWKRMVVDIQGAAWEGVDAGAMDSFQSKMLLGGGILTLLAWLGVLQICYLPFQWNSDPSRKLSPKPLSS